MDNSLSDAAPELLQMIKYLLLDLQGALELLDTNIHDGEGIAPSARDAIELIHRFDPAWEDPAIYALKSGND